jgi:multidrug efflux pump subunit AcrA (membrane-fusion protein)
MTIGSFKSDYIDKFESLNSINTPRPLHVLAWMMVCMAVLLSCFLVFTPWVQTAAGEGIITTFHPSDRPQSITAPIKGRIKEWHVHEGSVVRKGDLLVEIIDNDPNYIERLELELDAAKKKVEVAQAAAETAKIDFNRRQSMFNDGLASRHDLEKAKINYNEYLSKQASAVAELAKVQTNRSRQDTQLVKSPADGTIIQMRSGDDATLYQRK